MRTTRNQRQECVHIPAVSPMPTFGESVTSPAITSPTTTSPTITRRGDRP